MVDKTPRYNLGVVIRETGIKPDTLRAWERRYGLPEPNRTEGGHRLYSEYDIEMIKWLIARQDEGMRISNVVELWQSLVQDGKDPILEHRPAATERQVAGGVSGLVISELRQRWLNACLAFDEAAAELILTQAFARYPLETVCIEILQKGLAEMGELWFENKASVQQEHFTSALAIRRLNTLISAAPPPETTERTILACVPGEHHSFPILMVTLLLRYNGWNVVNLGQNVPLERMQQTIQAAHANFTILCSMTLETAAELLRMARRLQPDKVLLAYGGLVFARHPSLTAFIPAHYLGDSLEQVPQAAERILKSRALPHAVEPPNGALKTALEAFQEQHLRINARVTERMLASPTLVHFVEYTEFHLSRKVAAALTFGNLRLLEDEIGEIARLIAHYGFPAGALNEYLALYLQVLEDTLDTRGQPIRSWLQEYIHKRG